MLEFAGSAVVMANGRGRDASPRRPTRWVITLSNDEDGVAATLEPLIRVSESGKKSTNFAPEVVRQRPGSAIDEPGCMVGYRGSVLSEKSRNCGVPHCYWWARRGPCTRRNTSRCAMVFDLICDHREVAGDRVRLYMTATGNEFYGWFRRRHRQQRSLRAACGEPPVPAVSANTPANQSNPTPAEIREDGGKGWSSSRSGCGTAGQRHPGGEHGNVHGP